MVSFVAQLVGLVLPFALCSYVCIFAPPDTSGVERRCARMLQATLGPKRLARLSRLLDHSFQLVYLVVVLGSWSVVFFYFYPQLEKSVSVDSRHRYATYAVFVLCMGSWHCACRIGPGSVTARTIPLFDHYAYDDVLYADRVCPTLGIRKIARSKYCHGRHVPRFDHFCGWINQAVGERNYRWFLFFLAVQWSMCCYGTWLMARVLHGEIVEKQLLHATFFNAVTGEEVPASKMVVFHFLFARHFQICGVLLLMSVMAVMLGIFLAFHLCIASRNMTTNEFFKWRSVRRWHKKERRKYEQALRNGKIGATGAASAAAPLPPESDVGCTGPAMSDSSAGIIADNEVIDPGPMPKNIYNKGIIQNFLEILYPLSFGDEAIQRFRASLQDCDKCSSKPNCASEEKKTI